MSEVKVKCLTDPINIGEGPHWVPEEETLYFVNITKSELHRYHAPTQKHERALVEGNRPVTLIVPVDGQKDTYVVSRGRELSVVQWKGNEVKVVDSLGEVEGEYPTNTFNDGKCDATGRLWTGTKAQESAPAVLEPCLGSIYSLESDGAIHKRWSPTTLSNGLAWTADNTRFFFADSFDRTIDVFDFDINTPKIRNRQTIFSFKERGESGIPDGMTIDQNGNLWLACYLGEKVICIDPERGTKVQQIDFPVSSLTSCTFGGPNNDVLYVTSSRIGLSKEGLSLEPKAGALFKVEGLQVKGTPCIPCNLKL